MSASTCVAEGVDRKKSIIRVIGSSLAGTSLEWYDHAIYGSAAALVFPKLFFPQSDPLTGTLLSMTIYGVGFLSRPVGGLICGHFGDRFGRKTILIVTLLVMGVVTFLIGLLPTLCNDRRHGTNLPIGTSADPRHRIGRRVGRRVPDGE
jgi:MFS family permease